MKEENDSNLDQLPEDEAGRIIRETDERFEQERKERLESLASGAQSIPELFAVIEEFGVALPHNEISRTKEGKPKPRINNTDLKEKLIDLSGLDSGSGQFRDTLELFRKLQLPEILIEKASQVMPASKTLDQKLYRPRSDWYFLGIIELKPEDRIKPPLFNIDSNKWQEIISKDEYGEEKKQMIGKTHMEMDNEDFTNSIIEKSLNVRREREREKARRESR